MTRKKGKCLVLDWDDKYHALEVMKRHRYPEKNRSIFGLSFYLGLKAQIIACLKIGDIAEYSDSKSRVFKLRRSLDLPEDVVKSRQHLLRIKQVYKRKNVHMSIDQFEDLVNKIRTDAKANRLKDYMEYLPSIRLSKNGVQVCHSLQNSELRLLLNDHLRFIEANFVHGTSPFRKHLSVDDPLFITQKGGHYSPNTLQEHMAMVLRKWAGFDGATSHSGRRSLVREMVEEKGHTPRSVESAIGYRSATTVVNYE